MKHGIIEQTKNPDSFLDELYEAVSILGFGIFENFLSSGEIEEAGEKIDEVYQKQLTEQGVSNFDKIKDSNIARSLATEDTFFAHLAVCEKAVSIISRFLGDKFILFSQNGIINPANQQHYQSSWHRDLNYQHWTSSKPLGISILVAVEPFTIETGCTRISPATHKQGVAPSDLFLEKYAVPIVMKPGDAAVFDAMIFHKAGANTSGRKRRAINHIYTIPLMRAQFDFTKVRDFENPDAYTQEQRFILGSQVNQPLDPYNWRKVRLS
jgi:hypothetical protein